MRARMGYLTWAGVFVAGLLLGAILTLLLSTAGGHGPLIYPRAAASGWRVEVEYPGADVLEVARWYCAALDGCDAATMTPTDQPDAVMDRVHIATGVLQGRVVEAHLIATDSGVRVTQVPLENVTARQWLNEQRGARGFWDYLLLACCGVLLAGGGLQALGLLAFSARILRGSALNRRMGLAWVGIAAGCLLSFLDSWVHLPSTVALPVDVLGVLLLIGALRLETVVARSARNHPGSESTEGA